MVPATLIPLDDVPARFRGAVLAIGNFDGMHRGHHELLRTTRREADRLGVPALMLTFEPHPRTVLRPDEPLFRLTPLPAKARLAGAFGLDGVVVARFDAAFGRMSAERFVEEVLVGSLGVAAVVVGHDFSFGHDRQGSPQFLEAAGRKHGFETRIVDAVSDAFGEPYSATSIRTALVEGDIAAANRGLGYRWFVTGEVQHGDKRGRELGYPTANVRLPADCGLALGIYAVTLTRADGSIHAAVASYGKRPTFDNGAVLLEVHVFDFEADLYGEAVAVTFFAYLRGEERFESIEALVEQMDRDSLTARAILLGADEGSELDRRISKTDIAPAPPVA